MQNKTVKKSRRIYSKTILHVGSCLFLLLAELSDIPFPTSSLVRFIWLEMFESSSVFVFPEFSASADCCCCKDVLAATAGVSLLDTSSTYPSDGVPFGLCACCCCCCLGAMDVGTIDNCGNVRCRALGCTRKPNTRGTYTESSGSGSGTSWLNVMRNK